MTCSQGVGSWPIIGVSLGNAGGGGSLICQFYDKVKCPSRP